MQDSQPTEAEPWLRRAVQAMPEDYASNWALYESLEKQGKSAEAKAQLGAGRRHQGPQCSSERNHHAPDVRSAARPGPSLRARLLFLKRGSREVGERWLQSALSLDPHYGPAHAALADYYHEQGDEAQAALHRKEAQAAASTSPPAKGP